MKKNYLKPVMRVVRLKVRHHLLNGSGPAQKVGGNVFDQGTISGSNQSARSRSNDWWDDEE